MYAIVRTGGKQYRVEAGRSVVVERLPHEQGETVELKDVLLIAEDGSVTIGSPVIDGARVLAEVEANGRAKKIIVFKYKSKVRTRKKTGHRQSFTKLAVREIVLPGQEPKTEQPKPRPAKLEEAPEVVAVAETPVAAPEAEVVTKAAPKPRTRRAAPVAEAPAEKPEATRVPRKPAAPKAAAPKPAAPKADVSKEKPKRAPRRKPADKKEK